MIKTRHDGDCTIYSCLHNGSPENGICTCGYGHQIIIKGDWSEMYSKELRKIMRDKKFRLVKLLAERRRGKF